MKKNLLRMTIKSVMPDGSFTGSLAVYNNRDLGGDLIEPGAFTKTIKEHGDQVPLLWQHKADTPIGMLKLIDTSDALNVEGQLLMDLPAAKNAYLLIKAKIVKGLSIGFDTVKDAMDGATRRLKELRLWEGSIVTFPMNERAQIFSVKARQESKADFSTEYAEIQLADSMYQMYMALRYSLMSIPWADMERDEKIAASATSIEQFTKAYMDFIPAYIDWLAEEYGEMNYYSRVVAEQKAREELERKAGKKLSAATRTTLKTVNDHCKSASESTKNANDILTALFNDEAADDDTSDDKAAGEVEQKTEPAPDHSAAESLIEQIRSLIPAA